MCPAAWITLALRFSRRTLGVLTGVLMACGAAAAAAASTATTPPVAEAAATPAETAAPTGEQIDRLLRHAAGAALPGDAARWRVVVVPGTLDPRLRLAACTRIEPYLPAGARPWGRTRVGLRCTDGNAAWNVTLPVTVKVFGPALVAAEALASGTVLRAEHFTVADADWAAEASPVVAEGAPLAGRVLARPLAAGEALRQADLQARRWFAAGDVVRVRAHGTGFAVHSEGQAMGNGLEGQSVRVRLDSGRVLVGRAVGDRLVDVLP